MVIHQSISGNHNTFFSLLILVELYISMLVEYAQVDIMGQPYSEIVSLSSHLAITGLSIV